MLSCWLETTIMPSKDSPTRPAHRRAVSSISAKAYLKAQAGDAYIPSPAEQAQFAYIDLSSTNPTIKASSRIMTSVRRTIGSLPKKRTESSPFFITTHRRTNCNGSTHLTHTTPATPKLECRPILTFAPLRLSPCPPTPTSPLFIKAADYGFHKNRRKQSGIIFVNDSDIQQRNDPKIAHELHFRHQGAYGAVSAAFTHRICPAVHNLICDFVATHKRGISNA
ncbi:hypothetical protein D9615_003715 [Tricholomella constricta]|uniref:Uncharacterized protein n=1 Tax=Tricholomella constricta TaxID=117010 RepID=A0A8H5HI46_9AGAR|nr:hypothetical protein D9615_003715 [Tricholomella constricta]